MSLQELSQKCLYYAFPYNIYTQIPPSPNLSKYLNVLFHSHLGDGHATCMCNLLSSALLNMIPVYM